MPWRRLARVLTHELRRPNCCRSSARSATRKRWCPHRFPSLISPASSLEPRRARGWAINSYPTFGSEWPPDVASHSAKSACGGGESDDLKAWRAHLHRPHAQRPARRCDAIVHVVRCVEDPNIVHVDGSVDPLRDMGVINLELMLADLFQVSPGVRASVAARPHWSGSGAF